MTVRAIELRKRCPRCGDAAQAQAKLPGFPGPRANLFDLDDLPHLAARHSLGMLLALVELLPYKQFVCQRCGYAFRLRNEAAKEMVVSMLAALRPVAGKLQRSLAHPAVGAARSRAGDERPSEPTLGARHQPVAPAAAADWEPEGLD